MTPPKTYYTMPNGKHKIHITRDGRYTLCYREVTQDISEDRPCEGEFCQLCEEIHKSTETGEGIPF